MPHVDGHHPLEKLSLKGNGTTVERQGTARARYTIECLQYIVIKQVEAWAQPGQRIAGMCDKGLLVDTNHLTNTTQFSRVSWDMYAVTFGP